MGDVSREDIVQAIYPSMRFCRHAALKPGDAIGMHRHETDEDIYIILPGEGTFVNTSKEYQGQGGGDTSIARRGQSHALRNTGRTPLKFPDTLAGSDH